MTNINYNNNYNYYDYDDDDDSSNISTFSYTSFSSFSSFYSSPAPLPSLSSFKITNNDQLQTTTFVISASPRTNSIPIVKRTKITSSPSSSLTTLSSTRQMSFIRSSIAMTLPTEIICEIFDYLEDHPVHFTRGSLVCKTWYNATRNHLYWKRLCEVLKLPSPKPRAYKYKTYKSIIIRNWGTFCSLCLRKRKKYDPPIKPELVDMDIADIVYKKKGKKGNDNNDNNNNRDNNNVDNKNKNGNNNSSSNNNNSNSYGGISIASILNHDDDDDGNEGEDDIVNKSKLLHHLCTYCASIYDRYQRDEEIDRRRKKVKTSLAKCGILLPTNDVICERLIDDGNIKGISHYLRLEEEDLLELERMGL